MTILKPPPPPKVHVCRTPAVDPREVSYDIGTLWECPECGRWWKYREEYQDAKDSWGDRWGWFPMRWYDVPARRRIAAHETAKMRYRVPSITGDLHWWHCHPNPETRTTMNEIPEWPTVGNGCECWVNPNPWTYYGIPEPGDCIEYNPDCPEHGGQP